MAQLLCVVLLGGGLPLLFFSTLSLIGMVGGGAAPDMIAQGFLFFLGSLLSTYVGYKVGNNAGFIPNPWKYYPEQLSLVELLLRMVVEVGAGVLLTALIITALVTSCDM